MQATKSLHPPHPGRILLATRATNMSSGHASIPVFLTVDIEPDALRSEPAARGPLNGYETAHRYLSETRSVLQECTGSPARYCWNVRMDPQIAQVYGSMTWIAERYGRLIEESARAGDEIGLHPHWHRWDAGRRQWLLDLTDQAWIEDCLLSALDAFARAFGRPCRTVHLGSWVNDRLLQLADGSGVRFDLSLRPGQRRMSRFEANGDSRGALPSYVGIPRYPYRPSRTDFRHAHATDQLRLTTIPLTVGPLSTEWSLRGIARRVKYLLTGGPRDWRPLVPLYMTVSRDHPNSFADLFHRAFDAGTTHLAFVNRSDFGINCLENFQQALRVLMEHPAHARFVFTTPSSAFAPAEPGDEVA